MGVPILAVNTGSSSLKFSVFEAENGTLQIRCKGVLAEIGRKGSFTVSGKSGESKISVSDLSSHGAAVTEMVAWLNGSYGSAHWGAIGHRIVHGGSIFRKPTAIDEVTLGQVEALIPLAPLHQPFAVAALKGCISAFPGVPQVACFDTAFHAEQPKLATAVALPRVLAERGIRRYGFHGLSYSYIASLLPGLNPLLAQGRTIVAHLGSGASLCALHNGKSVAATMGFSVLDGLIMATRCGSLDPGIILYLLSSLGYSASEVQHLLYEESGLLGVSGISGDVRVLLAAHHPHAQEALDLYVYRIVRELGSLTAALQGLDGIIFTGGVGENSDYIRGAVLQSLAWLGMEIDQSANSRHATKLTTPTSRIAAYVLPTDESFVIAGETLRELHLAGF